MQCTNPYAITLVVLEEYKRKKINDTDLKKILKKYGESKKDQIVVDLARKYSRVPTHVSLLQLSRIVSMYNIPQAYLHAMGLSKAELPSYDACLDITKDAFDATKALDQKLLFSSIAFPESIIPLDNMSKAKHLVPGSQPSLFSMEPMREETVQVKRLHPFEEIAETLAPASGTVSLECSVYQMLHNAMKDQGIVRVLIRGRNR